LGARLGQHFLANPHIAARIAQCLNLNSGDVVLEIGPGKGALTKRLLALRARVVAVELDPALCRHLRSIFVNSPLEIVEGDILKVNLSPFFKDSKEPVKVAGNIPYKITSPLIERLTQWPGWKKAILMVQEEVAARITASPGSKTYGVLSVGVQLVAQASYLFGLSKNSFRPVPAVDSAVIELIRRSASPSDRDRERIMTVVRAAFSQRRKTITNAISSTLDMPKGRVENALREVRIDPGTRAETVDLDAFQRLSGALL